MKMENTTKTSTDLAITEKKKATHKPGGCVGIVFQLFDWNRSLAQRKLFRKPFLPPGRAEQCSEKFKSIEKMPSSNLHLIADENGGSFMNGKTDFNRGSVNSVKEYDLRAPTLVARLMGLESMPLVNRDKHRKASVSESCNNGSEKEDTDFEKGSVKIDLRPQKLRKTDYSDKQVVGRFGPEALPFKSVLSQSRKNHRQHKLPPSINSRRFSSGRSDKRTSRLINAASRILEPGLLPTNRAKSAITYANSFTRAERIDVLPLDEHNADNSFVGTKSCDIDDSLLGVGRVKRNTDEKPFICRSWDSNSDNPSSPVTARSKTMPSRDLVFENNVSFVSETAVGRVHLGRQCRSSSASSHRQKPRNHDSSSFPFKYGNQMSPNREKFAARSERSNLLGGRADLSTNVVGEAKDFDAFNRGICSRSRVRVPTMNGREEPRPQLRSSIRKRRMIGPSGFVDIQTDVNLNNCKHRNLGYDKLFDRRLGLDPCSTNRSRAEAMDVRGRNRAVVSSAFRSPARMTDRISAGDNSFDPATNKIGSRRLNEIMNDIALIIKTTGLSGVRLTGSKLSHAMVVLLFAELMSGNAAQHFISTHLFNDDTVEGQKEGNKQSGLLFDCLIESMGYNLSRSSNSGLNACMRLVLRLHRRQMIGDSGDQAKAWTNFSEMCLDEMIELEMDRSTGKWLDFSFEGFETGTEIEQDILQYLVDEILIDMCINPLKQIMS